MAEIVPFRGIRFAARGSRGLADLLAPPYELSSPQERADLLARSPHNIAHLSMGEPEPRAEGQPTSAETWARWLQEGVLQRDPSPSFYPVEQAFWAPDGRHVRRRGFLAGLRLHELSEGIVMPHERTHSVVRASKLEALRATRVNFSAPLGLFADERSQAEAALDEATGGPPVADTETDEGVRLRVWQVDRPETLARLAALVEDQRILLADGHHRYATALAYQQLLEEASLARSAGTVSAREPNAFGGRSQLPWEGGHHYLLMMLCSLSDPGLVIYPVHRLVPGPMNVSLGRLLEDLPRFFTVETLEEDVRRPSGRAWAISRLAEHANRSTAFLMISAQDAKARILTLRDDADLDAAGMAPGENARMIDVNVLHDLILRHLLGITPEQPDGKKHLSYVRDAEEAVSRVLSGEHPVGFLVNPAPMWQVRVLAEAGETMPPRTTQFRPALPAGLVMREVDPHGPA
jgi:uncharacterized protein (DUF1015 family)